MKVEEIQLANLVSLGSLASKNDVSKALFTWVRYRTVPKRGTERGCVHTGTEKIKRSVPKQVQKLGGTEK